MLGVVGVRQQLCGLLGRAAGRQQAERDACRLPRHSIVHVQHGLDVLKDVIVVAAEGSQAQAQAGPVLDGLSAQGQPASVADHSMSGWAGGWKSF